MDIAVFPGSFDPITLGHVDLVSRAQPLFDKIIVAVGVNNQKSTLFPLEKRLEWLQDVFKDFPKVEIAFFEGLTVKFCETQNARYLVRGLRNASDFDYEKTISQLNNEELLTPIERTLFWSLNLFLATKPFSCLVGLK